MQLREVTIRHYKSLDDVRVLFDPITVIVGPNGVGKTNFVDALKFVRDAAVDGLDHAVLKREGIDRIRQTYKSKPYNVVFDLEFDADDLFGVPPESYSLVLSGKAGDYRVESETCSYVTSDYLQDSEGVPQVVEGFRSFERKRDGSVLIDGQPFERPIREDAIALGQAVDFDVLGSSIVRSAQGWHFCALYPNTLRELKTPTKDQRLSEDGSNWASVVRALKRKKHGSAAFDRIADVMRIALEGYTDVSVSTAGSYLVPRITRRTGRGEERFDPVQLSDGTLRVFGILLALYQDPPPSMLIIEEPEQTIHAGVLPALADAFKEASLRTQIVITTHSPQLVDQFDPSNIRVAWSHNGLTRISSLKNSQAASVRDHLMSLQEYMTAEGLEPEEVA